MITLLYTLERKICLALLNGIFLIEYQKKGSPSPFLIYTTKVLCLLRTRRAPSNQIEKKGGGPAAFLCFRVYNSVHPITTGMSPIRNMTHKRKCLLNRSQEYQLQYLLSKEESFQ